MKTLRLVPVLALCVGPAPAPAADFTLYLPGESKVVLSLNVRQFLGSPAVREHAPVLLAHYGMDLLLLVAEDDEEHTKALKANRASLLKILKDRTETLHLIDLVREMASHLIIGVDPLKPEEPMIVVLGGWKRDGLDALLVLAALFSPQDFKVVRVGKHKVYEAKVGPGETIVAAVPEDGVLLMTAKRTDLAAVLERAAKKKRPDFSKEMLAALRKLDLTRTVSLVGVDPQAGNYLVHLEIQVERGIQGTFSAQGDKDALKGMAQSANEELDNLRKQAKNRKELAAFLPALKEAKVSVQGNQLTGTLKLSEQSLAELVKTLIRLKREI
jgi:hypothetical protein